MADFVHRNDLPEVAKDAEADVRDRIDRLLSGDGHEKAARIRADLQAAMTERAFVFRSEETLSASLPVLDELAQRYDDIAIDDRGPTFNYDLTEALELGYLLDLAEALVVSARARTESRGAQFRTDHPLRDDANWMKHSLATRLEDGTVQLSYKPVVSGDYLPMERKY